MKLHPILKATAISFLAIFAVACKKNINIEKEIARCEAGEINKIILQEKNEKTALTKSSDTLYIINGKMQADTNIVYNLVLLPEKLKIKTIAPKSELDSLHKAMATKGVAVSFLNDDDVLCSWLLGEYSQKYKATPLVNQDAGNVFYVELPGRKFNAADYLSADPDFFVNKQIINLEFFDISSVRLSYWGENLKESFKLEIFPKDAKIYNYKNELQEGIELKAVGQYLNYFKDICYYKSTVNLTVQQQEAVKSSTPLLELQITDNENNTTKIKLYPMKDAEQKVHPHKAYMLLNDEKQLKIIKYYELDLIAKSIDYFISK